MLFCKVQDSLSYKNRIILSGERGCFRNIVYLLIVIFIMLYGVFDKNVWRLIGQPQQDCVY